MLELKDISLEVGSSRQPCALLQGITAHFPSRHFGAIIGPSGCGKSTLLKAIAGLSEHTDGSILWHGRDLAEQGDLLPSELGYVPQFSIAPDRLTSLECLRYAFWLRVRGGCPADDKAMELLKRVGLEEHATTENRFLSGGQRRRLGLALELVTNPRLLLGDEVTSGLDPKSEEEITQLLHTLSRSDNRLVLAVTHSLRNLALYDSITVLCGGHLAYSGPAKQLRYYFGVDNPDDMFMVLATRTPDLWVERWDRKKSEFKLPPPAEDPVAVTTPAPAHDPSLPSALTQWTAVTSRRWRIFFRDRGPLWLQLSLLVVFPALVVLFALDGLPQIKNLSASAGTPVLEQLKETIDFTIQTSRVGGLVSGLVMFQVILLALMGSNNSAREIVSERNIYEKEKLAGLRPISYLASKMGFLFFLVLAQSVAMTLIVKLICGFPGSLGAQLLLLFLANLAMTSTCLAISAWARTTEQASLVSVYLVGFQLPLSGAVLALPQTISMFAQPLISSYWAWSGMLQTMRDTRFYDLVQSISETTIATLPLAVFVLLMHTVIGVVAAFSGCLRSRWD